MQKHRKSYTPIILIGYGKNLTKLCYESALERRVIVLNLQAGLVLLDGIQRQTDSSNPLFLPSQHRWFTPLTASLDISLGGKIIEKESVQLFTGLGLNANIAGDPGTQLTPIVLVEASLLWNKFLAFSLRGFGGPTWTFPNNKSQQLEDQTLEACNNLFAGADCILDGDVYNGYMLGGSIGIHFEFLENIWTSHLMYQRYSTNSPSFAVSNPDIEFSHVFTGDQLIWMIGYQLPIYRR